MKYKIAYLCDHKACEDCGWVSNDFYECNHTTDITHAKNFECIYKDDHELYFMEKENADFDNLKTDY